MIDNFSPSVKLVLKSEGKFSTDFNDPGNWTYGKVGKGDMKGTKYGISAAAWPLLDIQNLTALQAVEIYKKHYWDEIKGDDLPLGLDYFMFDFAVNSGVNRASMYLQEAVGATQDGIIGNKTLERVRQQDELNIIIDMALDRLLFMRSLSAWSSQGNGWTNRMKHVTHNAVDMWVECVDD